MNFNHLLDSLNFHAIRSAPDSPILRSNEAVSPLHHFSSLNQSASLLFKNASNFDESHYEIADASINGHEMGPQLVVVMVGLPARGKSYICKKLKRYLSWLGYSTRVFNVGNRRRTRSNALESSHPLSPTSSELSIQPKQTTTHFSDFFDPNNKESSQLRDRLAMETLQELIDWLHQGKGKIAIHDATNTTRARRDQIMHHLKQYPSFQVLFLESICDSDQILEVNMQMKLNGPDYRGMDPSIALQDFKERIANYEKAYEPLGDYEDTQGYSYIKLINVGKKIVSSNLHGYLPSQLVFYLMNTHIGDRTIWLTRHGESWANVQHKIGGDPSLTSLGQVYAESLAQFFIQQYPNTNVPIPLWTSTLRRSKETAHPFPSPPFLKRPSHILNEIHAGLFNDMTQEEVQSIYPNEYLRRQSNKLYYRYPGVSGESYLDVITRLKPIIIETERLHEDVIVISHQVVTRIILAYYLGIPLTQVPNLVTPLHTLYALKPHPYGTDLVTFKFDPITHTFYKLDYNELMPPDG